MRPGTLEQRASHSPMFGRGPDRIQLDVAAEPSSMPAPPRLLAGPRRALRAAGGAAQWAATYSRARAAPCLAGAGVPQQLRGALCVVIGVSRPSGIITKFA